MGKGNLNRGKHGKSARRRGGEEKRAEKTKGQRSSAGAAARAGGSRSAAANTSSSCSSSSSSSGTAQAATLPLEEQRFLRAVSLDAFDCAAGNDDATEGTVRRACAILERYHMVILHGVFDDAEIATLHTDYQRFLDFSGDAAIGEKDASKRSGTRLYNCACQVGPACKFRGWKAGSDGSKHVLHAAPCKANRWNAQPRVWERIVNHFGFDHVARVEVVTSHSGCRNQGWHTDGERGLTVIAPLTPLGLRKGPTEMDFTIAFNSLHADRGKVAGSKRDPSAPERARAAMPLGSVVLFNANRDLRVLPLC